MFTKLGGPSERIAEEFTCAGFSLYLECSAWDTLRDEYYVECDDSLLLADLINVIINHGEQADDILSGKSFHRTVYNLEYGSKDGSSINKKWISSTRADWTISVEELAEMMYQYRTSYTVMTPDLDNYYFNLCIESSFSAGVSKATLSFQEILKMVNGFYKMPSS